MSDQAKGKLNYSYSIKSFPPVLNSICYDGTEIYKDFGLTKEKLEETIIVSDATANMVETLGVIEQLISKMISQNKKYMIVLPKNTKLLMIEIDEKEKHKFNCF